MKEGKARASDLKFPLYTWSLALAMEPKTLETKLMKARIEWKKAESISALNIFNAMFGDEQYEKVRNLKLDANQKEREEQKELGNLFPMQELEPWLLNNYILPMRQILEGVATGLDTRCNPEHPEIARAALNEWIEKTVKPAIKEKLTKPKL